MSTVTGITIAVILILFSFIKVCRVEVIDVIYKGRDGKFKNTSVTYTHKASAWLYLSDIEDCIVKKYGDTDIEIICVQTQTVGWKLNW